MTSHDLPAAFTRANSTYSYATPRPSVTVLYNGLPIAEHANADDANEAILRLAKLCNTSVSCFSIVRTESKPVTRYSHRQPRLVVG